MNTRLRKELLQLLIAVIVLIAIIGGIDYATHHDIHGVIDIATAFIAFGVIAIVLRLLWFAVRRK